MRTIITLLCVVCISLISIGNDFSGSLFIIGGGSRPDYMMKEFIHLAGGDTSRIVIIPMASQSPEETALFQKNELETFGAGSVHYLLFDTVTADCDENLRIIRDATGIFFSGGDQNRLTAVMLGTGLLEEVKNIYQRGGVIGGTSAGAAVMSEIMITGDEHLTEENDEPFSSIRRNNIITAPGFGLMQNAIIDQHFVERKRHNRLISLIIEYPDLVGIGIAESTAIHVKDGNTFTVIGENVVIVYDARNAQQQSDDNRGNLSARNIQLHILKSGDRFNFKNH